MELWIQEKEKGKGNQNPNPKTINFNRGKEKEKREEEKSMRERRGETRESERNNKISSRCVYSATPHLVSHCT